jgi:ribosome biogenesis GTPase
VCVFVGPSGVGKSSLQNALDPTRARATAAVRASDGKGRHTTTAGEWSELANGAVLIDTPGVREFGLAGLDARALAASFAEFAGPARACRFRDCSHLVEPACGVRAALAAGAIDRRRFESYARIRASLQ